MDWSKLVKARNAPGHKTGRAARFLDTIAAPFLKTNLADGSVARKKGGALFAVGSPPKEIDSDGYYVLGKVGAEYRIMGSSDARGRFIDRGAAGSTSFALANLAFYGGGYGFDLESEDDTVGYPNFDGKVYPFHYQYISVTRTGKTMKLRQSFVATTTSGWSPPQLYPQAQAPLYEWSGTVLKDGEHVRRVYFVGMQVVDQQHVPRLYADPADGTEAESLPCLYIPGQLCVEPLLGVMDTRGKLMLMNKFMRPTYADSSVNVSECPGLLFTGSSDHGGNWEAVNPGNMFNDAQSLAFLPVDPNSTFSKTWAFKHNEAIYNADFSVFCTSPATCQGIVLALTPVALFVGGEWKVRYRSKIGRYSGFTMTESVMVCESEDADAVYVSTESPVPLVLNGTQGVLYLNRYVPDLDAIGTTRPTLMWTDGLTTTALGVMPFQNNSTGGLTAIGRDKIVCTMFDGEYSLYELTSDMTWTRRATVHDAVNAALPDPDHWIMQNFARLTFLRKEDRPVPATPSAPWMTNSRRLPPTP